MLKGDGGGGGCFWVKHTNLSHSHTYHILETHTILSSEGLSTLMIMPVLLTIPPWYVLVLGVVVLDNTVLPPMRHG